MVDLAKPDAERDNGQLIMPPQKYGDHVHRLPSLLDFLWLLLPAWRCLQTADESLARDRYDDTEPNAARHIHKITHEARRHQRDQLHHR